MNLNIAKMENVRFVGQLMKGQVFKKTYLKFEKKKKYIFYLILKKKNKRIIHPIL